MSDSKKSMCSNNFARLICNKNNQLLMGPDEMIIKHKITRMESSDGTISDKTIAKRVFLVQKTFLAQKAFLGSNFE